MDPAGVISSEKWAVLERRRIALGIRLEDLEELFIRSGGPGGQNVNKTSTCVLLRHRPSGLQVKCQTTRHQALNRFIARRLLLDKIEAERRGAVAATRAAAAKTRRQKARRSRGAKERMLADKARRADRKAARRQVRED